MGSEPTKLAVSTISEPITTMLLIFSSSTLLAPFSALEIEIASNHSVLVRPKNLLFSFHPTPATPFEPVTVPFDQSLRGNAVDLPESDHRVKGFEPEQISVSLSANYDSVWISWVTGESQIGYKIKPLDPKSVASVVRYGKLRYPPTHEASTNEESI